MGTTSPAPATLGKYQIRGVLGRGAMGTVYDGWDPVIGRRVAIKTVRLLDNDDPESQEGLARFKNEAQAAGRLSHPNIVAVYDYGESDEIAFIVMEFVEGQSLKERLDAKERFPVSETVRIMEQVLAGLQFSHDKGVIHRDIKPGNVMMTRDGQVKLADFGIARIESSVMTQAGTMLGTPAYMSPEQLMAQTVDARSDIYSSGVLLYQLLTGERPFEGGLTAIIHKALNTTPPNPSEISVTAPPSLDAVVARAMARRPADRYADASSFARALREAFETPDTGLGSLGLELDDEATMVARPSHPAAKPDVAPPAMPRPTPPRAKQRPNPAFLGATAVVLLLAIGAGAWFALWPSPPESPPATASAPAAIAPQPPVSEPPVSAAATDAASTPERQAPPAPPAPRSTAAPPTPEPVPAPAPPPTPQAATAPPAPQAVSSPAPPPAPPTPQAATAIPAPQAVSSPAPPPTPQATTAPSEPPATIAPQTPIPPAPAPPANPAAAIRDALNALAASARCALPRFAVSDDGGVGVSGPVAAGSADESLRAAVGSAAPGASVIWNTRLFSGPYCDVLDTIRPIAQPASPLLGLSLKDDVTRLKAHELIRPVLTMPAFPAFLLVDYYQHDGSVTHLYPIRGVPNPPFGVNAVARLGTTPNDQAEVGAPFGTDMIVATASSVPLFPPASVRPDETIRTYMPALKAAIEAAERKGGTVTGRAMVVETVER